MSHLTAQNARVGLWEVAIFNPTARTREYLWEGKKRHSYHFQCMLVSASDPTQYVLGDTHGKNMSAEKLRQCVDKLKAGLVFRMSKVDFASNTKQQYNSAPKTELAPVFFTT